MILYSNKIDQSIETSNEIETIRPEPLKSETIPGPICEPVHRKNGSFNKEVVNDMARENNNNDRSSALLKKLSQRFDALHKNDIKNDSDSDHSEDDFYDD